MPPSARIAAISSVFLLATALTACSTEAGSSAPPEDASALGSALARIGADDGGPESIVFSDRSAIGELPGDGWRQTAFLGAESELRSSALKDRLGVDLLGADTLLTVGSPPAALTLVSGGQDSTAITDAVTSGGWTGGDVLTRERDLREPFSLHVPQIRTTEDSVALGGASADLTTVDPSGASLADDPIVGALSECLGDVVAAAFAPTADTPIAVGTRLDSATDSAADADAAADTDAGPDTQSVVCVHGDDPEALGDRYVDAFSTGRNPVSGHPYTDFLENPTATIDGDTVQVLMETKDAGGAVLVQLFLRDEMPPVT